MTTDRDLWALTGAARVTQGLDDLAKFALAQVSAQARDAFTSASTSTSDERRPGRLAGAPNPVAAAMVQALCDHDDATVEGLVSDLFAVGVSAETICLDHLAPAARHLGHLWETDRLSFTEVTFALAHLHRVLRDLPQPTHRGPMRLDKAAMIAAIPGEQHTLGSVMAANLLRRDGWDIALLVGLDHDVLVTRLCSDDRPIIGLSCAGVHTLPALVRLANAVIARRPGAHLFISGQIAAMPARLHGLSRPVPLAASFEDAQHIMSEALSQCEASACMQSAQAR